MFNSQKFLTRGVEREIPAWLVNLMWHIVLTMEVEKKGLFAGIHADEIADRSAHYP